MDQLQQQLNDLQAQFDEFKNRDFSVPHKHNGFDMYRVDYGDLDNKSHFFLARILGNATANAVAASVGGDVVMPFDGVLLLVGATVDTAGTTGTETVDVLKNGTTVMATTKITIDTGEKSSRTAVTIPALTVQSFLIGDVFTFDITGIHTTPALGLTVFMKVIQLSV